MSRFDVIVIGELNVDLLLNDIALLPTVGKEIIANQMKLALGSSSAIFASNSSTLGLRVGFLGKVGRDDFGSFCVGCLNAKNVDTSLVSYDDENGTGITVAMIYDNDRAMVTYPGAMKTLTLKDINFQRLSEARHIHFSSYFLQPGIGKDLIVIFRKAKEMGLTVSFDTQWDPDEKWDLDLKQILPHVDVFLPNQGEFEALTGSKDWEKSMYEVGKHARIIAMKAGKDGSYVYHNGKIIRGKPFLNENVVDPIGAGDSYNAGFIYRFLQGDTIEKCQEYANLIGAVSTTAEGGTGAFTDKKTVDSIARTRFNYIQ